MKREFPVRFQARITDIECTRRGDPARLHAAGLSDTVRDFDMVSRDIIDFRHCML